MNRNMMARCGVAGVVGLAMLGAATVASSTSAMAGATPPKVIVLTNASNGSTVVAAKGDLVRVKLKATDGVRWSEAYVVPGASVSPLVKKSGGVTSTGSSVTTFEVVGYGTAELEATGTPSCTGVVCPTYVLLWQATVDVPVVDPPGV